MANLKGGTTIGGHKVWTSGNDGAGSGLVADKLDDYELVDIQNEIDSDISTHTSNANAHHSESHTAASHSDQITTGAEIDADHTKLAGIESGATADQTGAEIKSLYEAEANTNAYTDGEKTKLSGIADGAEVNVQSDWNASSGDAFIQNKPSIPTVLGDLGGTLDNIADGTTYVKSENNFTDALLTKLNAIEAGATGDMTASELLTLIKTVDGDGSGLDACTLDGQHAVAFATSGHNHDGSYLSLSGGTLTGVLNTPQVFVTKNGTGDAIKVGDDAWIGDVNVANMIGIRGAQDGTLGGFVFGSALDTNLYRYAANTLRTDDMFMAAKIKLTDGAEFIATSADNFILQTYSNTPNPNIKIGYGNGSGGFDSTKEYLFMNGGQFQFNNGSISVDSIVERTTDAGVTIDGVLLKDNTIKIAGSEVWHPGNDGSGSGLEADMCDGQHLGTSNSPTFANLTISDRTKSYELSVGSATDKYTNGGNYPFKFALNGPMIRTYSNDINEYWGNRLAWIGTNSAYTISTSGTVSGVEGAFKTGDTYASIGNAGGNVVIEVTGPIPGDTNVGAQQVYMQAHGTINGTLTVEVQKVDYTWVQLASEAISLGGKEYWFSPNFASILTYPTDYAVRGIRWTISSLSETTTWIRQLGFYSSTGAQSCPLVEAGGDTMYGDLNFDTGTVNIDGNAVWHAGNDGEGSGLHADLLDGVEGTGYLRRDIDTETSGEIKFNTSEKGIRFAGPGWNDGGGMRYHYVDNDGYLEFWTSDDWTEYFTFRSYDTGLDGTGAYEEWFKITRTDLFHQGNKIWHAGNDGAASGLHADLLDGLEGAAYVQTAGSNLTGSFLYDGRQDYKGIYWGDKFEDAVGHAGLWAYIRQGSSEGQLEIGSDDKISIYETDSRVLAVEISTNNKTLDAKGGLLENGVTLTSKYQALSGKGVANGYASLDSSGLIPIAQLPDLVISEVFEAASEAAMLALSAQKGDVCIRSDTSTTYILGAEPASTLANWKLMQSPADAVSSVDGRNGAVTLSDLYLGLTAQASDSNKLNGQEGTYYATASSVTNLNRLAILDTRGNDYAPNTYDKELEIEFKYRSTVGNPGSTGTYCGLITFAPWGDNSGGDAYQLAFTQDGDMFMRNGLLDDTSWTGAWNQFWHSGNDGSGSGLNADKLDDAELSTDSTLGSNSDAKVPTEKAVKTYVETYTSATLDIPEHLTFYKSDGTLAPIPLLDDDAWEPYHSVKTITANYTANATDATILCNATSGDITVTLPPAVTDSTHIYHIKKTDATANVITIDGNGSETIDGELTWDVVVQWECLSLQSDGTQWVII